MAAVRLPKNVRRPSAASWRYSRTPPIAASENQAAKGMKLKESSFAEWGKLKEAGTMTSGYSSASGFSAAWRRRMSRAHSPSMGSTTKRLPVMKAVITASRAGPTTSR
jgi:hypothetical protein